MVGGERVSEAVPGLPWGLEARVRPSETPGGRLHTCVAGVLDRALLGCGPGSTPSSLETKVVSDADVLGVCLVQQVQLLGGGTGVSASDIGEQRNGAPSRLGNSAVGSRSAHQSGRLDVTDGRRELMRGNGVSLL